MADGFYALNFFLSPLDLSGGGFFYFLHFIFLWCSMGWDCSLVFPYKDGRLLPRLQLIQPRRGESLDWNIKWHSNFYQDYKFYSISPKLIIMQYKLICTTHIDFTRPPPPPIAYHDWTMTQTEISLTISIYHHTFHYFCCKLITVGCSKKKRESKSKLS